MNQINKIPEIGETVFYKSEKGFLRCEVVKNEDQEKPIINPYVLKETLWLKPEFEKAFPIIAYFPSDKQFNINLFNA